MPRSPEEWNITSLCKFVKKHVLITDGACVVMFVVGDRYKGGRWQLQSKASESDFCPRGDGTAWAQFHQPIIPSLHCLLRALLQAAVLPGAQ
ncbi:hypothetical protein QQF64_005736 [Cirrhinus molitorella]|uniref:Uncharacterized protein n=1 Tax=Cirrhinus molitorella TaxID=172907 RepID=A0ABR3MD06_9TELE